MLRDGSFSIIIEMSLRLPLSWLQVSISLRRIWGRVGRFFWVAIFCNRGFCIFISKGPVSSSRNIVTDFVHFGKPDTKSTYIRFEKKEREKRHMAGSEICFPVIRFTFSLFAFFSIALILFPGLIGSAFTVHG